MKILHSADWHLGRVFHERSLINDQARLLDQLIGRLAEDDYAALAVAGDIFDRSIPSAEAMSLLSRTFGELRRRFPDTAVLAIPGNHDSAERLDYAAEMLAALDVHIVSRPIAAVTPIWLEKAGERCACFLLPFLTAGGYGSFPLEIEAGADGGNGPALRSQQDLLAAAAGRLEAARLAALDAGADATLLLAHLFAAGGREAESERCFLGTAERIDIGFFAGFDYVALGHLHRPQRVGANAWYAGSPLAYSFDEADDAKAFLAVGIGRDGAASGGPAVMTLPVVPYRPVRRLAGPFADFHDRTDQPAWRDDYLEIALDDPELVENPLALLRQRFPNLLAIRQNAALERLAAAAAGRATGPALGERRDALADFADFLTELYGQADPTKLERFAALAAEASDASA